MAAPMSSEQIREFLSAGTRTGKLAIVAANGSARVVPVWFVLDGDDVVFMTGDTTVKGKAMKRDPRVCLVVDLEVPPFAFVQVRGTVALSEDADELLRFSIAIATRYMGDERAEEFGRRNAVPGELLVRLTPTKIAAFDDVSG